MTQQEEQATLQPEERVHRERAVVVRLHGGARVRTQLDAPVRDVEVGARRAGAFVRDAPE